jgi:TrmH family RNA methyltransferase
MSAGDGEREGEGFRPLGEGRRKAIRGLLSRKGRERAGRYLLEGPRLVEEALAWDVPLAEAYVAPEAGERVATLAERLAGAGVPVMRVSEKELRSVSDVVTPQGVLAVGLREMPPPIPQEGLVLLLDAVQDPGNVGTLLRAADAFEAEAVLVARGCADLYSPKVLRAAMGSAFHLPVIRTGPAKEVAAALASAGFTVLAATLDGDDPRAAEVLPERTLLVLGNETRGPHPAILKLADGQLTVPIPGPAESLNVAMAGAILLAELARLPVE